MGVGEAVDHDCNVLKRLGLTGSAIGLVTLVSAFDLRTWRGRGSWSAYPRGKVLLASWLASELWVDPWLLIFGLVCIVAALVLLLFGRCAGAGRPQVVRRRGPTLS